MGKALAGTAESPSGEEVKVEDPERRRARRFAAFALVMLSAIMSAVVCSAFVFV